MSVYLLESFLVLLAASVVFFLLGTSLGWVLWGRFKKMLGEWRSNSERLNKRIANLEEETDRSHLSRHELETEKAEILEVFARRNRESHEVELQLEKALANLTERDGEVASNKEEIRTLDEEIRLLRIDVKGLMEALAKRDALVEALNDRIESIQRDRDDRVSILKAKIIAAEQERDERKSEVTALAKRLAAAGKLSSEEASMTSRRRGSSPRGTKPSSGKATPSSSEETEELVARNSRSRRAAKRDPREPVAKGISQMDLGLKA
jgi:chromosome segregation ATPase